METVRKYKDQRGSKATIIQMLRVHGSISRMELTKLTDLSRATISIAVNELIELGLIRETEPQQSTGGRPAINLELVPNSHIILGADLIDQAWVLGAFDLLGNTLLMQRIPYASPTPEAAVQALAEELPHFVNKLDKEPIPLIGLGIPGLVDTNRGLLHSSAVLGWRQVELSRMMTDKLRWTVVVLNRSRARGLAESRYGAGRHYNQMIYIGIDTGIGAGIYVQRELIHGAIGGAGELGHTSVELDGVLCLCGNRGCLQMYAAAPAIELEARKRLREDTDSSLLREPEFDLQLLNAKQICQVADQGDELAVQVVNNAATYLGMTMANLVNLLNPEAIILGGMIPMECSTYLETAVKVMRQRSIHLLSASTVVHPAIFKDIGGALGAANFALDEHMSFSFLNV